MSNLFELKMLLGQFAHLIQRYSEGRLPYGI